MSDLDDAASSSSDPGASTGTGRGWKLAAAVAVVAAIGSVGTLAWLLMGSTVDPSGEVRACIVDPTTRDFTKDGEASRAEQEADGHERPQDCPPADATMTDGLVTRTSAGGFRMRRLEDGVPGAEIKLHVREPDRPYIDIAHAATHAALGQPIRVYTLEIDGRQSVVYMEDTPLLR